MVTALTLNEAFEEKLKDLRDDHDAYVSLVGGLLRRTAKALGKPEHGKGSSWHDIPDQVAYLKSSNTQLRATLCSLIVKVEA